VSNREFSHRTKVKTQATEVHLMFLGMTAV